MPHYEADDIASDLRSDLPVRLAAALSEGALVAWGLSRGLHRCATRSPFYSDDQELLAMRLRAHLPRDRSRAPEADLDPLHPARFGPDGIDIADLAVVAGAVAHYHCPGPYLEPVPQPLVDAPHTAPPWVARRFFTDRRIAWLADVTEPARAECLDTLVTEPERFSWLAFAIHTEAEQLSQDWLGRAADTWRALLARAEVAPTPQALATMAAATLVQFEASERERALAIATAAAEQWRPFMAMHRLAARARADANSVRGLLTRVKALMDSSPFRDHRTLRREARWLCPK
jgi:hypothetical protein